MSLIKDRVNILQRRYGWLIAKQKDYHKNHGKPDSYTAAEIDALEWVFEILVEHKIMKKFNKIEF